MVASQAGARAKALILVVALLLCRTGPSALASDRTLTDPDLRAARIEAQMSDDERLSLLMGRMMLPMPGQTFVLPDGVPPTAGYVPGVRRLGVPPQIATDASLGVCESRFRCSPHEPPRSGPTKGAHFQFRGNLRIQLVGLLLALTLAKPLG